MDRSHIKELDAQYIVHTYNRYDVVVDHACGAVVTDADGKEYVDLCSGYAANSLGYQNEAWLDAVIGQLKKVQHTSNLYYSEPGPLVAEKLVTRSGLCKVWFANSGGEANEAAIKTARKYGNTLADHKKNTIISLKKSFHGRTMATVTATGLAEAQEVFEPLVPGFVHAEVDDAEALEKLVDQYDPCAFLMELVQGEGGVMPLDQSYVEAVQALCAEKDILFMVDEVQTGISRTGDFYCYQGYGVKPDVVTSAKGIAGGLPMGACLCSEKLADVMSAGTHGTTFGGNPVACAAAKEVLSRVSTPEFLAEVKAKGAYIKAELEKMGNVKEVRGKGLMIGIVTEKDNAKEIAAKCVENGLLILTAKTLLRLLPPLTITYDEINKGLDILKKVMEA